MLRTGATVPEVEAALIASGLDVAAATNVVDDALRANLAIMTPAETVQAFNWVKVLVGLGVAALAFIGIYIGMVSSSENVVMGVGAVPGAIRGAIFGGGCGMAVAGLNMVRVELMRLWQ